MRDSGRWHLTDFQRSLVVVAIVSASFLSAMSLGMRSFQLLLIALVLFVGAGLGVFLLGLRYSGRGTIRAVAHVITAGPPPPRGKIVGRCDLRLIVELPERKSADMRLRDSSVPVIKWPRVGMVLPVEVTTRNGNRVRVRWDKVEPHHTRPSTAAEEAAALAVPFFTDYAEGAFGGGAFGSADEFDNAAPDSKSPQADPANDAPSPVDPTVVDAGGAAGSASEVTVHHGVDTLPSRLADFIEGGGDSTPSTDHTSPGPAIPHPRPAEGPSDPAVKEATSEPASDPAALGIMLMVSDLDASLRFYRDLVDFVVVDSTSAAGVLAYGGGRVLLRQASDRTLVDRGVVHVHIQVADVRAAYRYLKSRGVKFIHEPRVVSRGDQSELLAATLRDPDGHEIALTQWRDRDGR